MKKKILGGIAILAIAAVAAWNVSLSLDSQKNKISDLSLSSLEAHADNWLSEWWNSQVYTCETQPCSKTYSFLGFYSGTYYGTYSNCVSGSSYAHCWDCESSCNAY